MVESFRKQKRCTEPYIRAARNIPPSQKHDMNAWTQFRRSLIFTPASRCSRTRTHSRRDLAQHAVNYTRHTVETANG